MYRPTPRTVRVRPETEEGVFVKKLAASVILRAVQDLLSSNNRQADGAGLSDRAMSEQWIFGEDVHASFETWCSLANLRPNAVRRRARELMEAEHREHHWRPRAPIDANVPRIALARAASGQGVGC
jgi:hypothetical protein